MYFVSILTLFPDMMQAAFGHSIIKRAIEKKAVDITSINIRDFSTGKYKSVDDHPYGGGQGMILKVDVLDRALTFAKKRVKGKTTKTILLDPQGSQYTQKKAELFSREGHLVLVCGHYEGVDERIRVLVDEEISIGDYVLTGGEIPAMAIVDSVVRLLPGVLARPQSTKDETFSGESGLLEYPQYTRPKLYKRKKVPAILLSGHHQAITDWRKKESHKKTKKRRPDLLSD